MVTTRPPKMIVKPTALGPVANTDTKLLIYGLFQKGRVLAQDGDQRTDHLYLRSLGCTSVFAATLAVDSPSQFSVLVESGDDGSLLRPLAPPIPDE